MAGVYVTIIQASIFLMVRPAGILDVIYLILHLPMYLHIIVLLQYQVGSILKMVHCIREREKDVCSSSIRCLDVDLLPCFWFSFLFFSEIFLLPWSKAISMEWDNLLIWEFSSPPQLKSKHHIRQSVKIIEIETDGINNTTVTTTTSTWNGVAALHFGLDYQYHHGSNTVSWFF